MFVFVFGWFVASLCSAVSVLVGTLSAFVCRVFYICGGDAVGDQELSGSKKQVAAQGGPGRPSNVSLQRAQKDLNDRQLMYVAWQATPAKYRKPATQREFAAELGVSEVTVWRWSKDPKVLEAVRWMVLHHAGDPARISDVINFLQETAMDSSARLRDRMEAAREYLKAVGVHYAFKSEPKLLRTVDVDEIRLDELSDDEVWELYQERAGENGLPISASTAAEFDSRAISPPSEGSDGSEGDLEGSESDLAASEGDSE